MGSGVSLGRKRARKQLRLEGHEGSINAVSLTSDGGLVVTGSDDCTARVWDAETRELVAEMKGHAVRQLLNHHSQRRVRCHW